MGNCMKRFLEPPADGRTGFTIDNIFINQGFWMTPGEAASEDDDYVDD